MTLSRNMLKRVGESRHPCWTPPVVFESVSYAVVEEGGISGLVKEVFDDLDKVCADIVLLHGCPQSCMPNPVEGLLEVCEVMARSCWYWRYFSQRIRRLKICSVMLLPALKPACSSAMIFSACGFNLFSMTFSMTLLG